MFVTLSVSVLCPLSCLSRGSFLVTVPFIRSSCLSSFASPIVHTDISLLFLPLSLPSLHLVVTDPAFLVSRSHEDFLTWVDGSKIKRAVMKYNDKLDDFDLLGN